MSTLKELIQTNPEQKQLSNLLRFDRRQFNESIVLLRKYYDAVIDAKEVGNNPIQQALALAQEDMKTEDPQKVQYALMIFTSHHPDARKSGLRIPPLTHRAPEISIPKAIAPSSPSVGSSISHLMKYYHDDPNLNEHHEHWHNVYPPGALPDPFKKNATISKDRQGELYDAERIGLGLEPIKPFSNYREPIPEGYNPDVHVVGKTNPEDGPVTQFAFSARPAGAVPKDLTGKDPLKISDLEEARANITKAIQQGKFDNGKPITADLLGNVIQSTTIELKEYRKYGDLHNNGHFLLSYVHNPNADDKKNNPGILIEPRSAVRDPLFFRWHKHIDEFFVSWQKTLPPHDFKDSPPVKIQQNGFILAFKDKIPGIKGLGDVEQDKLASKWGEEHFGGANYIKDPDASVSTTTLETKMKTRTWTWVEDDQRTETIEYLFPREWYYFFRVENTSDKNLILTFRIFLAPEKTKDSFESWIELDKFKYPIGPKAKVVVARDCDKSSVVRQPPQKTVDQLDDTVTQPGKKDSDKELYCDCGWPFHLLLPRGAPNGTPFKLLAFVSDWNLDKVPDVNTRCGSLTFCGAERPGEKYPDIRPMGYPFDAKFKDGSFEKTFTGLNNAAIKNIKIAFVKDFPEIF
ncbi:11632_t:CDS:2 [Entrophospora sp. SA101]|nr:11632_t:CDS:2 [Entrophospora sp. SA101]CAJ0838773.1 10410_t:CDS:2 [Entrophospora sp. SA101]CAJ0844885.1 5752_t:CDS:2 [Entrophospora sp. SA101]